MTAYIQPSNAPSNKEQFAILAVDAILPKGIQATVIWSDGIPKFSFRVRYMHNGTKKSIGTFNDLTKATQALAAAKAADTMRELPSDWQSVVANALETLIELRTPESLKDQMLRTQFGASAAKMLTGEEQQKLYDLIQYIAPHTLVRGKQTEYIDEDTGEVTKIPGHLVTRYLDVLEAELMRIKYAPSGEDIHGSYDGQPHGGVNQANNQANQDAEDF